MRALQNSGAKWILSIHGMKGTFMGGIPHRYDRFKQPAQLPAPHDMVLRKRVDQTTCSHTVAMFIYGYG